jgi:hypothetical protein
MSSPADVGPSGCQPSAAARCMYGRIISSARRKCLGVHPPKQKMFSGITTSLYSHRCRRGSCAEVIPCNCLPHFMQKFASSGISLPQLLQNIVTVTSCSSHPDLRQCHYVCSRTGVLSILSSCVSRNLLIYREDFFHWCKYLQQPL